MASKTIYLVLPRDQEYADVRLAIREAVLAAGNETDTQLKTLAADHIVGTSSIIDKSIRKAIERSSLVIADTTAASPFVMREVGIAQALGKTIIIINQEDYMVPFDIGEYRVVLYDRSRLSVDLVPRLTTAIMLSLRTPEDQVQRGQREEKREVPRAFVSYSHADRQALDRLLVHLRPLQRRNLVEVWADTEIKGGDRWEEEIASALQRAAIAVLLISADFLASEFIIDNELAPLLEGAREKGTRILPVVLKPCRFERDRNLSQFQAVNQPSNPVLALSLVEQGAIWDSVAYAIETEIEGRSA